MEDFLSDIETNNTKQSSLFSKCAFGFAIANIILVLFLAISVSTRMFSHRSIIFSRIYAWTTDASILAGTVLSIISIIKKEKLQHFKIIGVFINFILFLLIAAAVIFAVVMRYKNM